VTGPSSGCVIVDQWSVTSVALDGHLQLTRWGEDKVQDTDHTTSSGCI